MKGKICDGDKGMVLFSMIFSAISVISFLLYFYTEMQHLPLLPIGVGLLFLAVLIIIPHEYIDGVKE